MDNYNWKTLICKDTFEETLRIAFLQKNLNIIKNKISEDNINDIIINCYNNLEEKYPNSRISILQLAIYQNWYDALKILVKKKINIENNNPRLYNQEKILYTAIANKCSINIIKLLIKYGCNIEEYSCNGLYFHNALDYKDKKPIHIAIITHHIAALKLLIDINVDIESKVYIDYEDEETEKIPITPIQIACYSNNIKAFELLLKKGANINYKNFSNNGITEYAAFNLADKILKKLKDYNININDIKNIIDFIRNNNEHVAYNENKIKNIYKLLI